MTTTPLNLRDVYLQASASRTIEEALNKEEKPYFIALYDQILNQQIVLDAQATSFGITTQKTSYDSYITALTTYLGTITIPVVWNNLTNISKIVRSTFTTKFSDVDVAKKILVTEINNRSSTAVSTAQADATNALNQLTNIASDNILSPSEKPYVKLDYDKIINEQTGIDALATSYGLTSLKSTYDTAVSALTTYLGTLSGWNTIPGSDVVIVGTTFRTKFTDVYTARQALLNATDTKAGTLADWTNIVGQANAPANNASADIVLIASSFMSLTANTAEKISSPGGWDGSIRSKDSAPFGAMAYAVAAYNNYHVMFGLNGSDTASSDSYLNIDYAIYVRGDGVYDVYETGSTVTSNVGFGTYAAGDVFAVIDDDASIRYLKNGVVFYTSILSASKLSNKNLYFDSSFLSVGARLTNIRFVPLSPSSWSNISGQANAPANNATVGADSTNLNVTIGGDNLANNSSFEAQSSGFATGYTGYNNAPVTEPSTSSTGTGRTGIGLAQIITWTGGHSQTKGFTGQACRTGWLPNKTYTISIYAKTTNITGSIGLFLAWNTAPSSVTNVLNPPLSTAWQRYVFKIIWGASVESSGIIYLSADYGTAGGNVWFDDLMVTEGDFAPMYAPSVAEVSDAAATALANAATAQTAANSANTALTNIASDGILSPSEKPVPVQNYNVIISEQTGIDTQATAYGITTEKTVYDTAVSSLTTYLGTLSGWNTIPGTDVTIVGSTFRSNFAAVYTARQTLLNKIAELAGTTSTWTGTTGAGKPSDYASADVVMVGRNCTISGNSVKRTTGGGSWDADGYTLDGFTRGAYITGRIVSMAGQYTMIGLCLNPASGSSYTNLAFAIFIEDTGTAKNIYTYRDGTQINSFGNIGVNGDIYGVYYDDVSVNFTRNGAVFSTVTSSVSQGLKFFGQVCIVSSGVAVDNIRFGPLSSNDFGSIGGVTRPSDNASSDLILTSVNMTVVGNTATKTGGTNGSWDSSVYTPNGFTNGAYAEARITSIATEFMFGLNQDPTANSSYDTLDYAWYIYSTSAGAVYESNVSVGVFATVAVGDILSVVTDGVNVFYLQNGVIRRTVKISASNLKMHFDSSFKTTGASISNIRFGPMSNNDFAAVGGATRPADNASSDVALVGTNTTIIGNSASKTGGTNLTWDSQVFSLNAFTGGAYAEARIPSTTGLLMFGLNTDPATDANFSSIDFAIYTNGGTLSVYESNVAVGTYGTYSAGDLLAVTYDGVNVRYLRNGVVFLTRPQTNSALILYFDSSFYTSGIILNNIRFGPLTNNDYVSIGGDSRPVDNATVGPADAATAMGFNPQFSAWPAASTFPTGWGTFTGTPTKESTTVRTAPYAVKWTCVTSTNAGMFISSYFTTTPQAVGTYLAGSFDVNITTNNSGTCRPGYLIRLYTNSALTTYVDSIIAASAGLIGWQRIPFTASVGLTQQIYGIDVYQMASWSSMPGGYSTGGSICIFDNLTFNWTLQLTDSQYNPSVPSISGLSNINLLSQANGVDKSYGTRTATPVNMTSPYAYSWTVILEYGDNLYLTNSNTATPTFWGSGTNKYVMGQATVVITDSKGRTVIGGVYVNVQHGTGVPP